MPSVTIVTPWFNHLELLPDYINAVAGQDAEKVILVDNGSDPCLPPAGDYGNLVIMRFEENLGFAKGSNIGLAAADTDVVLFLNSDIEMTSAEWLEELRETVEPGVLVGARIRFDAHASVDGLVMPYLDGWCLAGMRADLLELGGFDESFEEPAYYSDNVLCLRARAAGMRLRECRVGLRHKENVTAGPGSQPSVLAATAANKQRYLSEARALLGEAVSA